MSHIFPTPQQGPATQRITGEEAKQLIREHQNRETEMPGSVTVQDMAEALNLPTWQVEQMVRDMRNRPPVLNAPMSGSTWLKTQLWKWALAAIALIAFGPGIMAIAPSLDRKFGTGSDGRPVNRATNSDGIYKHEKVVLGRELGMTAPPGFSYEIKYGSLDAAANGDSRHYIPVEDLSKENVAIVQEQYVEKMIDGFDHAVAKYPPEWVNGEAPAVDVPNYYPGGFADPIDLTLRKDAFPYDPNSASGKAFHDTLLKEIQDHWDNITSDN